MPSPLANAFLEILKLGSEAHPLLRGVAAGSTMGAVPQPQVPAPAPTQIPGMDVGALRQQFVQNQGAQGMGASAPAPQPAASGGGMDFGSILEQLLIPAATAGLGVAMPQTLPGAAGFQTGYTESVEKNRPQKIKIFDEETGEVIDTNQVTSSMEKILTKSKTKNDILEMMLQDQLLSGLVPKTLVPELKTGDTAKKAKEKVKVINAQGQEFMLPPEQLEEAKKQGYKLSQ